jgi:iron complex transport system permease protein
MKQVGDRTSEILSPLATLQKAKAYRLSIIAAFLLLAVLAFLLSCSIGSYQASIPQVIRAIFVDTEGTARNIIWNVRVPRNLVGACAGACLALSGAMLQGMMRNPLASPNIIGVSSGAGLGAMLVLVVWPQFTYLLTPVAFLGGLGTTILIYSLSYRGGIQPLRMVLSGIAISSLFGAVNNAILIFYSDRVQSALGFMVGSLSAKSWIHVRTIWPYTLVGIILAFVSAPKLNVLTLSEEMAIGLGLKVERTRMFFIALAALLAAASVSVVGIMGFVGLIVPHIVRLLIGSDYRYLLPASVFLGAALVMLCDTLSRTVFMPIEIPVGISLAVLGAPFFLYLLRRRKLV